MRLVLGRATPPRVRTTSANRTLLLPERATNALGIAKQRTTLAKANTFCNFGQQISILTLAGKESVLFAHRIKLAASFGAF